MNTWKDIAEGKLNFTVGCPESHFFDSGAFSQAQLAEQYHQEHGDDRWAYFDLPEFWQYVDDYCDFIVKYKEAFDLFANLDVIGNPKLTWRNQQYIEKKLEKHGLRPVPCVHYPTDHKWLTFYMDKGYEIIGLGGLVGNMSKPDCKKWLDKAFNIICDTKDRCPKVKIHGFGVSACKVLIRYPWYSVDTAGWDKVASFGGVYIPQKRNGKFVFYEIDEKGKPILNKEGRLIPLEPNTVQVSMESIPKKKHLYKCPAAEIRVVEEWLKQIDIPMGKINAKGEIIEKGVVTWHVARRIANMVFLFEMQKHMPDYPWPFHRIGSKVESSQYLN